jgi:phosphatidate cytidylyltransferase
MQRVHEQVAQVRGRAMNGKGFLMRVLLVAVAFPVIGVLIFFSALHHLAINVVVALVSVVGALEMASLFKAARLPTSELLAPLLAATLPTGAYLEVMGVLPAGWMGIWIPAAFGIILVRAVLFSDEKQLKSVLPFASTSLFTFLYPGFFLTWIVRMTSLPDPSLCLLFFFCLVFSNDMSAYLVGSLWGRRSRLNLPVSPNKSVAGFVAGLLGSLLVVALFTIFSPGFPPFGLPSKIALGICTGVTVILGDLLESGLKRSAGVKDSGIVIPGRGGLLDSIDSMLFAAPLFYYFLALAGR